jgi:hypothetical protein
VLGWLGGELAFGGGVRVGFAEFLGGVGFLLRSFGAYFMCRLLI